MCCCYCCCNCLFYLLLLFSQLLTDNSNVKKSIALSVSMFISTPSFDSSIYLFYSHLIQPLAGLSASRLITFVQQFQHHHHHQNQQQDSKKLKTTGPILIILNFHANNAFDFNFVARNITKKGYQLKILPFEIA